MCKKNRKRLRRVCLLTLLGFLTCVPARAEEPVVGTSDAALLAVSSPTARCAETSLGDVTADAVLQQTGADAAIINGGCFAGNLNPGDVSRPQLEALFTENKSLGLAWVSPSFLKNVLEAGTAALIIDNSTEGILWEDSEFDGFPQVAGIRFVCDVSAPSGERITHVWLDGRELDLTDETEYIQLAATEEMLGGAYGMPAAPYESAGMTLADAMEKQMRQGPLDTPEMGRITLAGVSDNVLIGRSAAFTISMLLIAFFLLAYFGFAKSRRRRENE